MLSMFVLFALLCITSIFLLGIALKVQQHYRRKMLVPIHQYGKQIQLIEDKYDLHKFGIGQFLKRQYGDICSISISLSAMGLFVYGLLMFGPMISHGGMEYVLFGFVIAAIFSIMISALLAEQGSLQPTSGGMYHIAYRNGGRFFAGMIAGLQLIGQFAISAFYSFSCVYFISMLFQLYYEMTLSSRTFFLLVIVLLIAQGGINLLKFTVQKWIQGGGFWIQVSGIVLFMVTLYICISAQAYSPILLFELNTDWQSIIPGRGTVVEGAMMLALLCKWFVGSEQAQNGAEETLQPRIRTSWSTFLSSSYLFIIGFIILLLLCMLIFGFVSEGQILHLGQWFSTLLSLSGLWGVVLLFLCIISCFLSGLSSLSNSSRLLFTMARDHMLPYSQHISKIHLSTRIPMIATVVASVCTIIVYILLHVSTQSFIIDSSIFIVFTHYTMYVLILYFAGSKEKDTALWSLGNWSIPLKKIALLWLLLIIAITGYLLTKILVFGVLLLSVIIGFIGYRLRHRQPLRLIHGKGYLSARIRKMENEFQLD